jgi:hypothetical protein
VLHVVFEEVPLQTDVLGLLADQGILGVCNGALVVLPNGGGFGDAGVKISLESCRRCNPSLVASAAD